MRPPGESRLDGGVYGDRQHLELGVDRRPQSLEDPLGRVAPPAHRGGDGRAHHVRQRQRRAHRPGGDDGGGDTPGEAGLPVQGEQAGQVLLARLVQVLGGRARLGPVHAHVQRGVGAVTETPLGPVELGRADAQVEQGARDRCDAELVQDQRPGGQNAGGPLVTRSPKEARADEAAATASASLSRPRTRR